MIDLSSAGLRLYGNLVPSTGRPNIPNWDEGSFLLFGSHLRGDFMANACARYRGRDACSTVVLLAGGYAAAVGAGYVEERDFNGVPRHVLSSIATYARDRGLVLYDAILWMNRWLEDEKFPSDVAIVDLGAQVYEVPRALAAELVWSGVHSEYWRSVWETHWRWSAERYAPITLRWPLELLERPVARGRLRDNAVWLADRGATGQIVAVDDHGSPIVHLLGGHWLYLNYGVFGKGFMPDIDTPSFNVLCTALPLREGTDVVARWNVARGDFRAGQLARVTEGNLSKDPYFELERAPGEVRQLPWHEESSFFPVYAPGERLLVSGIHVRHLEGLVVTVEEVTREYVGVRFGSETHRLELRWRDLRFAEYVDSEPPRRTSLAEEVLEEIDRQRTVEELEQTRPSEMTDEEVVRLMEHWALPTDPLPVYDPRARRPRRPRLERQLQDPKIWAEYERLGYGPMMSREAFNELVRRYRHAKKRTLRVDEHGRPIDRRLYEGLEYNPGRPYEGLGCVEEPE